MKQEEDRQGQEKKEAKQIWEDPKLAFVEPKLVKQGELKNITAGNFGTFVPKPK